MDTTETMTADVDAHHVRPRSKTQLFQDVREFMEATGQKIAPHPEWCSADVDDLRTRLASEEYHELHQAWAECDMEQTADAICDLIYVLVGTAWSLGIDLHEVWDRVHTSNMAKLPVTYDEHGKVQKPDGWEPPDVLGALRDQGYRYTFRSR